jgi:hypothetical protein
VSSTIPTSHSDELYRNEIQAFINGLLGDFVTFTRDGGGHLASEGTL